MTPVVIVILAVFLPVLLLFYLLSPAAPRPEVDAFTHQMYAHRGLHAPGIPENSLAAFAAAKKLDVGVELDVQLSLDGEVMVFHDATLHRMCACDKELSELTAEQLAACSLSGTEEHIPTLSQALESLKGLPVICEIKAVNGVRNVEQLCRKTEAILRTYPGRYCIESFSPFAVRWFYKHAPDIVRGQLVNIPKKPELHTLLAANLCFNFLGRPDFIACNFRDRPTPGMRAVRAMRTPFFAWTPRGEEQIAQAERRFDTLIFEQTQSPT